MSSKQWHGGKGDTPRVGNDEAYRSNWDRIFGGIDYADKDLKQSLYHSSEESVSLSPGKNSSAISPDTLINQFRSDTLSDRAVEDISSSTINNNGENK